MNEAAASAATRLLLFPIRGDTERVFRWYVETFRRPGDELIFLAMVETSQETITERSASEQSNEPLLGAAVIGGQKTVHRFVKMARMVQLSSRGYVKLGRECHQIIVETAKEQGIHVVLLGSTFEDNQTVISIVEYVMEHCPEISTTIVPCPNQRKKHEESLYKQFINNFL